MSFLCAGNKRYIRIFQSPNSCHGFVVLSHCFLTCPRTNLYKLRMHIRKCLFFLGFFVDYLWENWICFTWMIMYVCICLSKVKHNRAWPCRRQVCTLWLWLLPWRCQPYSRCFAKLLRDLERPSTSSSRTLFVEYGTTPLYEAVLEEIFFCLFSLQEAHMNNPFLPNLCLQLYTFNLKIVSRTTNVDTCFVFGLCL